MLSRERTGEILDGMGSALGRMVVVGGWSRPRWSRDDGDIIISKGKCSSRRKRRGRTSGFETDIFGADVLELGLRSLSCTEGGEFGDQVTLSFGPVQRLELSSARMRQMMKMKGIGDEDFDIVA